jgi:hypothetical protein
LALLAGSANQADRQSAAMIATEAESRKRHRNANKGAKNTPKEGSETVS